MSNDFPTTPPLDNLKSLITQLISHCGYRRGTGWARPLFRDCIIVTECKEHEEPLIECKPFELFDPSTTAIRPKHLVCKKAPGFQVRIRPDEFWKLNILTNGYLWWKGKHVAFAGLAGYARPGQPTRDDDHLIVLAGRPRQGYYVDSEPCLIEREMPGKWVVREWLSKPGKSNVRWFDRADAAGEA